MKIIARRTTEKYDAEKRCKYGVEQYRCEAYVKDCQSKDEIKPLSQFGRCVLSGSVNCPQYKKRKLQGSTKKTYSIDWKKYRQIASAAHYLIKTSEHKTLFLTLTFPQWRGKHKYTKSFYYDEISNVKISNFLENLRKNYGCTGYIGVKEYGEATKRVHFHLIISYPFIDFRLFNNIWVNSISDICCHSACAVRREPGKPAIIRNPARAIRYVCKYISKCYGQKSETRTVFISRNLLIKPFTIKEQNYNHIDYLKKYKSIYINTFEHVTVYKITDRKEFNRYCHEFLYPLFELSIKWSEFYYCSSDSSG